MQVARDSLLKGLDIQSLKKGQTNVRNQEIYRNLTCLNHFSVPVPLSRCTYLVTEVSAGQPNKQGPPQCQICQDTQILLIFLLYIINIITTKYIHIKNKFRRLLKNFKSLLSLILQKLYANTVFLNYISVLSKKDVNYIIKGL